MNTRNIKQLVFAIVAVAMLLPMKALSATLTIEDFTIKPGETKEMLVDVNNADMQVTMVEFFMHLPNGLSVATEDGELAVDIAGRTTWKKHSLEAQLNSGVLHLCLYSGSNATLSGTSGAVISVKLTAASSFTGGNITLKQQVLTAPDETESKPADYNYNVTTGGSTSDNISFADAEVKRICVENWDTNGDGELSKQEAEAVTDLGEVFRKNKTIKTFNELQNFTGLTSIGNSAFYYCSGLTSVTIPNSVTSIGRSAFEFCTGLTSVIIPNSVTTIEAYAFYGCSGLTSIIIGNGVTSIRSDAFAYCTSLTSITIPNSVRITYGNPFRGCSNLKEILVQSDNAYYTSSDNGVLFNKDMTQIYAYPCARQGNSYTIPNTVNNISNNAFYQCTGLTSVTIPNSVTSIGGDAFSGCSGLTSVNIPNSVTSMESYAFYNCRGLKEVHSMIEQPFVINDNAFQYYDSGYKFTSATLYVPAGTKALYEATDGWKNFTNIVEMEDEDALWEKCDVNGDGKVDVGDLQTIIRMMGKRQ